VKPKMRCGRSRCATPTDDVEQVKAMTLCRAHRALTLEIMSALKGRRPRRISGVVPVVVVKEEK